MLERLYSVVLEIAGQTVPAFIVVIISAIALHHSSKARAAAEGSAKAAEVGKRAFKKLAVVAQEQTKETHSRKGRL
jgi:hypothetical protein